MLAHIAIKDFALIEEANIQFNNGFQLISGETGAGKSLLLGAISAISGATIRKDFVRSGSDLAMVEAVFFNVRKYFEEDEEVLSYLDDEDQLILSREIRTNGRNLCRVNARICPLSFIKRIGERLCDIHGQNDRQQIFDADRHLTILDRFGDEALRNLKSEYQRVYQAWQGILKQEREIFNDPEERRMLVERLEYQIDEIESVSPLEGEDESLQERRDILFHTEKLSQAVQFSLQCIQGANESAGAKEELSVAWGYLDKASSYYPALAQQSEALQEILSLLDDVQNNLEKISNMLQSSPGELEKVEERLDAISKLKRKYGGDIESVYRYLEKAKAQLEKIQNADAIREELADKKVKVKSLLEQRGLELREKRKIIAQEMSQKIVQELQELGMEEARFQVQFKAFHVDQAKSYGLENCEFMLAANRGENVKPLAQTASGGEASRIMLAIKVSLAAADDTPLLVFDEIDTGISGHTTQIVGEKLKMLGKTHQVLCVSHQAQIAAKADTHFFIYKTSDGQRTRTKIRPLSNEERVMEVARLLSGKEDDQTSIELARQLMKD